MYENNTIVSGKMYNFSNYFPNGQEWKHPSRPSSPPKKSSKPIKTIYKMILKYTKTNNKK